jgi:DNA-binding NarL/FixJ family response regulator
LSLSIRVAIVEDDREFREELQALIAGAEGFSCSGAYATMEEALSSLTDAPPDVGLFDIGLPGMTGIEGIRRLRSKHPQVVILILTVFADDDRIFDALCAGASGYLLKRTSTGDDHKTPRVLEAIREAAAGGAPMSPEIARKVVEVFRRFRPPAGAAYALTPHEIRILSFLAKGHSYRSAAKELHVTANTISFHLRSIYGKLAVHSKSEAVAMALRAGLIR